MIRKVLLDEQDLLEKISIGDIKAFGLIYERYYNHIYTFSLQLLKKDVLAEEVVQEAFLKLWRQGYKLKEVRNLEAFLVTIARNRALDILRKTKLEIKTAEQYHHEWCEMHNETEESITLKETKQILDDAIQRLPRQQMLVYQLCHQQGLKYEEAAKELNLSVFTVQSYMKLALKNLRKQLAGHKELTVLFIILKLF